jgi:hypothetical protein
VSRRLVLRRNAPQPVSLDVDEARLLPVYRRANPEREQAKILAKVVLDRTAT